MKQRENRMKAVKVLIVDDFPQVREELDTILSLAGDIEVVGEASDGTEAIQQAEALKPDVVLMDLEMPVMDGYEATRKIKKDFPTCWVIALTVHGGGTEREKATAAGFDDFVVKGAPLDRLVQAILKATLVEKFSEEVRNEEDFN
jgi:DNA-binding NarL/FixJ family response regulator